MTIIKSTVPGVGSYPDDKDLYTFLFEHWPSYRFDPRGKSLPLLIDELTGQSWTHEQCRERVDHLAAGLRDRLGVRRDTVVAIFSPNTVDYLIAILALHKLGAIASCANPSFNASELSYQIDAGKSTAIFVGEEAFKVGSAAAEKAKMPKDHVIIMQTPATTQKQGALKGGAKRDGDAWYLEGLVAEGRDTGSRLHDGRVTLKAGEARKKIGFLSFSSGTTGLPKGVMIQHYAPISNIQQFCSFNGMTADNNSTRRFIPGSDVSLGVLPFYHIYGLVVGLLWTFYSGIANVVLPRFAGIEPMIKTTLKYRVTLWWLVPPQVVLLVKDPTAKPYHADLAKQIRFVMIGAAPLSDDVSKQLEKALPGVDWGQGSGMTESSTVLSMHPTGMRAIHGSAGRLLSDVEAQVVSPEGKVQPIGELGELWVRSPSVTLGYLNNRSATEEMWVEGGWLRTGDEVKFNEEGDMFILDRLKELVKVNGNQVAPAELEGWILNHEDVADVGVIGLPNEMTGEIPIAFVALSENARGRVSKGGQEEADKIKKALMKFVADNKIRYKHLGAVHIIDAIPKNPSGKLLRRELRERAKKLPAPPVKSKI